MVVVTEVSWHTRVPELPEGRIQVMCWSKRYEVDQVAQSTTEQRTDDQGPPKVLAIRTVLKPQRQDSLIRGCAGLRSGKPGSHLGRGEGSLEAKYSVHVCINCTAEGSLTKSLLLSLRIFRGDFSDLQKQQPGARMILLE